MQEICVQSVVVVPTMSELFSAYPGMVDISQMSEMLNISKNSCYRLVKNKTIRSLRVGKKHLIPKEFIVAFINAKL